VETQILYNGTNPFAGISPTPLVGKNDTMVRFHDRWMVKSNIMLAGTITGACSNGYSDITTKQKQLIQKFSDDFKTLSITEQGNTIYSAPFVTIDSIKFDENPYVRLLPYTVSLSCYQSNLFVGNYGISEPTNKITWTEGDDGIVTVLRSIGAKGFNTSSTAKTNNAKTWVQALTGFNYTFFAESLPAFITYKTFITPCIKEVKETVDRFNATYTVDETYRYDPKSSSSYILKYATEFNYDDKDGIYSASINGDLEGCPSSTMTDVRNSYKSLNLYNITNYEFSKTFPNTVSLNPEFLTESITENQAKKIINFSKSWDSDPRGLVLFEYSAGSEYNLLDDVYVISINGTISARDSQKVRWDRVLEYYKSINIFNLAQAFYYERGYPYQLVKLPNSYTATENKFEGTVTITATYTDQIAPPNGFDAGDYSITIKPSINQILPVPVLCGKYYLINLNALTRAEISVAGNLTALKTSPQVGETRNFAKKLILDYIPSNTKRVLKEEKVDYVELPQGYSHSFNRAESFMGEEFKL
jgi:hypothetical protein